MDLATKTLYLNYKLTASSSPSISAQSIFHRLSGNTATTRYSYWKLLVCLSLGAMAQLPSPSTRASEPNTTGQVGLFVGYDDNVTYAGDAESPSRAGWVGLEPALVSLWGLDSNWALGVTLAGTYRGYFGEQSGWLIAQVIDIPLLYRPNTWFDLRLTVGADHFYTGLFSDSQAIGERVDFAGSFYWENGSVLVGAGLHIRHWLDAEFERTDIQYLPRVQLTQTFAEVITLFVGYQFAPRTSTTADFDQWGHRGQLGIYADIGADMDLMVVYMPYIRAYTADDSPWETAHTVRSRWSWKIAEDWRLEAEAETVIQEGVSSARSFIANTVSLGVVWTFGEPVSAEPLRIDELPYPFPPRDLVLTPFQLPNGVRFRLFDLTAQSVQVVGSFNDWDPNRHPLHQTDKPGLWEIIVPMEVGSYEYAFVVDGSCRAPEHAEHVVQSGFGDVNGIVVVRPLYRNEH